MDMILSLGVDFWAGFSFGLVVAFPTVLLVMFRHR